MNYDWQLSWHCTKNQSLKGSRLATPFHDILQCGWHPFERYNLWSNMNLWGLVYTTKFFCAPSENLLNDVNFVGNASTFSADLGELYCGAFCSNEESSQSLTKLFFFTTDVMNRLGLASDSKKPGDKRWSSSPPINPFSTTLLLISELGFRLRIYTSNILFSSAFQDWINAYAKISLSASV